MVGETATELEAMRKDDRSWHPCRISLRPSTNSTNSIIIVDFCDLSGEEIISSEEEALKHLRYSSTFLRDGKCASIDEGECVLAMNKLHSQSLFFDAVVEKMLRVRHSKRVYCRCTFEVKWIHSKWNWDVMILSSGAIKKLSKKSIKNHPVIVEFLNSLTSATSFSEEIKGEAAIQGLVESQIEKISTVPEEVKGPDEARVAVTKVLSEIFPFDSHNEFEGYNKVQKTLQFGEVDKNLEDRPFLSPLAARAALASLVHDLPRKSEIFVCHTGEGFSQIPFINSVKHIDFPSSNRSSFTDSKVLMHRSLTAQTEGAAPLRSGAHRRGAHRLPDVEWKAWRMESGGRRARRLESGGTGEHGDRRGEARRRTRRGDRRNGNPNVARLIFMAKMLRG